MRKRYWLLAVLFLVVLITYFSGPKPPDPVYSAQLPALPDELQALEGWLRTREDSLPIREDNQARIVWQADSPSVTEYSVVYLHGFAGSYRDGYPVNVQLADTLQANLYLSRWAGHGLRPPASLKNFSAEAAWQSAKEALVIGQRIGQKVIILSTSTGGTLAIKLAATYPDKVHALINLSPNIKDDQVGAFFLNSPWGYELAKLVSLGKRKKVSHEEPLARQYWDTVYTAKALVDLQVLVASTMQPTTFKKVQGPVLTLFYQENPLQEDEHVEVNVYPDMYLQFASPDSLLVLKALEAPETHFIGSDIKSDNTQVVLKEIVAFLQNKLGVAL